MVIVNMKLLIIIRGVHTLSTVPTSGGFIPQVGDAVVYPLSGVPCGRRMMYSRPEGFVSHRPSVVSKLHAPVGDILQSVVRVTVKIISIRNMT